MIPQSVEQSVGIRPVSKKRVCTIAGNITLTDILEKETAKMNEYVIETRQLTKTYGSLCALDHVDIHVRRGCIYGLIGDNGAGKSTLLKLLAGQIYKAEGEITLLGRHEEKELEHVRKNTGCMIEQPEFFPNMTVEQTLRYYCIQKGIPDMRKAEGLRSLCSESPGSFY